MRRGRRASALSHKFTSFSVRRTSRTLLGPTARSCREQCRQTTAYPRQCDERQSQDLARQFRSSCSGCVISSERALLLPFLPPHVGVGSFAGWLVFLLHYCSVYRREHVLPRRVNCSGEDWKLTVPSVIRRDERRVPADKFQGRPKFSNNAAPLHIACPLYPGQSMEIQTRNEIETKSHLSSSLNIVLRMCMSVM